MRDTSAPRRKVGIVSGVALLGLLGFLTGSLATPASAGSGVCATATIAEPFVLPDGSRHPAGVLKLCHGGTFSPVSSFHTTFVDRMPVAMFLGHHQTVAPAEDSAYALLFARADDSQLRLIGYTLPSRGGAETHMLDRPRVVVKQYLDPRPQVADSEAATTLVFVPATLD